MIVDDPSGAAWRVKRRWLPWRLRKREPEDVTDDLLIGVADDIRAGRVTSSGASPTG